MSWIRHGKSLVQCSHGFSRFQSVVEDYDKFDVGTKNAILKASSSVVSLISRTGDKVVFIGSGTIIECEAHDGSFSGTILTSATFLQGPAGEASIPANLKIDVYLSGGKLYEGQVLNYDFYYNIATIKVKSKTPFSAAKVRYIDDAVAINSNLSVLAGANLLLPEYEEAAATRFNLCPGELVIALARYSEEPHEIMAAPGLFSCDDCPLDCKELFMTTCTVNKAAVGGPLVNCYGEVIGINFISCPFNVFLPTNIAFKCLEDLKRSRQVPRPWLGVVFANLYTAKLEILEELTQKFPHVVKGVKIEQVKKIRIHSSMKRKKVHHWTFWTARKWLKAITKLENIKKKKRTQTRVMKMKGAKETIIRATGLRRRGRHSPAPPDFASAMQQYPASLAGLCADDVIISCDGKSVGSHLEFVEALWNMEGKPVELTLVRPRIGQQNLTVTIGRSPKMNRWHLPFTGFTPTLEERLAIERKDKMKFDEME